MVALIVIFSQKENRWKRFFSFYGSAVLIIVAGFFIFGYLATSSFSVLEIYQWFRGYLGNPIYGTYLKFDSIPIALKTALNTILVPTYGKSRIFRFMMYLGFLGSILFGLTQIKLLNRNKQIILLSALLQCLLSWLLIYWFEPFYPKFWLLTLVPTMIVLAYCMQALEERLVLWSPQLKIMLNFMPQFLILIGLLMVVFNLKYAIIHENKPDKLAQEAINIWLEHSDQNDMLITAGDLIPQLWFWENRPNTIHLYHFLEVDKHSNDRFGYLRHKIDQQLCNDKSVIFAPAIVDNFGMSFLLWLDLSRDDLRNFFETYSKEELFTYRTQQGIETQVYRLVGPKSCGA